MPKTAEVDLHQSFLKCEAAHRLHALARYPYDLTSEGNLTPQRVEELRASSCGYLMLYGTERVTHEVMRDLFALAKEMHVFEKMRRMKEGEVVNYIQGFKSEERPALHMAARAFFGKPPKGKMAAEAVHLAKRELEKLKSFIEQIDREKRFDTLVSIGIGGSDLGPKAHYIALQPFAKEGRSVRFISNVDPDDAFETLRGLDLKRTLVVVISKSGTTLETRANEEFVRSLFTAEGVRPEGHFIAVTGESSPMDDPKRYLKVFYIWDWIGGRYSTTSMAGGVSLSFAFGFDLYLEFLRGAWEMDETVLQEELQHNLPLLGALLSVWNRSFLSYPTLALIPYSQALARYPAHIQQLEMESNGKHIDQMGRPISFPTAPIIWGEPGTNAQHSFFQMIHQGTDLIPLEFIGFKESQAKADHSFEGTTLQQKLLANLFAQAIALAKGEKEENPNRECAGNRPSHILLGNELTPRALGSLLSYFENKIAFEGFIWGINSFDQEGVQLGKHLASKVLDGFKGSRTFPLGDAYIKLLNKVP
jgi:glucose-6-phosphate isomerase